MVSDYEWISPTRMIGLSTCFVSMLVCLARWFRCRNRSVSGEVFGFLAAVELGLLLDMEFDWRWKLHDAGIRKATSLGLYEQRSGPQVLVLLTLAVMVALFSVLILSRYRHRSGAVLAMLGALLSVALWCVEVVSYHFVDHILYHMVGGVMAISFLWLAFAGVTCAGVWADSRKGPELGAEA